MAARSAVELGMAILPWMVLHHVERLLAADVVENVLTAVGPFAERIQDPEAGARLPAVAFVDISGPTALTESVGNDAGARATSRFEHAVTVATAANAGQIVISDAVATGLGDGAQTARSTSALELEALGEVALKGIDRPVRAFRTVL